MSTCTTISPRFARTLDHFFAMVEHGNPPMPPIEILRYHELDRGQRSNGARRKLGARMWLSVFDLDGTGRRSSPAAPASSAGDSARCWPRTAPRWRCVDVDAGMPPQKTALRSRSKHSDAIAGGLRRVEPRARLQRRWSTSSSAIRQHRHPAQQRRHQDRRPRRLLRAVRGLSRWTTWREIMGVNIDGMFLVAQAVGKQMIAQGHGGSIIQTASIYGVVAPDQRIYEGSQYLGGRSTRRQSTAPRRRP